MLSMLIVIGEFTESAEISPTSRRSVQVSWDTSRSRLALPTSADRLTTRRPAVGLGLPITLTALRSVVSRADFSQSDGLANSHSTIFFKRVASSHAVGT